MIFGILSLITNVANGIRKEMRLQNIENLLQQQSVVLSGLQTSMGLLGVGSILNLGCSAFSLYKINKISKDINILSNKIDRGFLDMQYFISEEIKFIIDHQQKVKLSEAYTYYQKALENFQRSLAITDKEIKNKSLFSSIEQLDKSLIIYDSQKAFQDLSIAGQLKQLEIVAMITSVKAEIYFLMGEAVAGKDHYSDLLKLMDKELKNIGNNACENTIDLILSDTFYLRLYDLKLIKQKLDQ